MKKGKKNLKMITYLIDCVNFEAYSLGSEASCKESDFKRAYCVA